MSTMFKICSLFCILILIFISPVSAAIHTIPSIDSMNAHRTMKYNSIPSSSLQSDRILNGPTADLLLCNYRMGLKVDPDSPFTPIDEHLHPKCILYNSTTNNGYYIVIDGYYTTGSGYVPHATLTLIHNLYE